jgi:hypothetical protein
MNPYPASREDQRAGALAALRAALAQQAEPVEPVATVAARQYDDGTYAGNALDWAGRNCEDDFPVGTKLYTAPPQRPAESVPEPVGQLQEAAFGRGQVMWFDKPADGTKLYTAPPQRLPLTEEEIAVIEESCMGLVQYGGHENMTQERVFDVLAFARAVERKVRGELK